jgi:hypothetical protein
MSQASYQHTSAIDFIASTGVAGDRQKVIASWIRHFCAELFQLKVHPQVVVRDGLERFRSLIKARMQNEAFTPFEMLVMFELVRHYADNPQDLRTPEDLLPVVASRVAADHKALLN